MPTAALEPGPANTATHTSVWEVNRKAISYGDFQRGNGGGVSTPHVLIGLKKYYEQTGPVMSINPALLQKNDSFRQLGATHEGQPRLCAQDMAVCTRVKEHFFKNI